MKKLCVFCICLWITTFCVFPRVRLSAFFSDHMVLQQQTSIKIAGQADRNKQVTLQTSWDNKTYTVRSSNEGYFECIINTPSAGGPYTISISDGEPLIFQDILIGEVWLCSGQSNMEMPVKGFRGQPVEGSQEAIIEASSKSKLRLFTVKRAYSKTLQENVEGTWLQSNPESVSEFSATAYFFGSLLQKTLDVPVGLIHASWSASKIEAWMDKETLSNFQEVDMSILDQEEFSYPNGTPTLLYNAMIYPMKGLVVKGVIWYQGESNSERPDLYQKFFPAWINQWRMFFNDPQLPVYYTQIAPYQSSDKNGINLALFRECQLKSMETIPNVGMAFTTDIGNEKFIHAPKKRQVGERLAYWALAQTYDIAGITYSGPVYTGCKLNDNIVEVQFKYADIGLNPENENIIGFEISGSDGVFVPAQAQIINASSKVKVWNDMIPEPVEVRYCFRNYMEGNLKNNAGLPAAAFRVQLK